MLTEALATQLFLLILSGILLVITGNWVIDSSKKIILYFKLSGFTVGFVFLAVATSLPELAVILSAGALGQGPMIIGNVVGSNIADILLVLGVSAVISQIPVRKKKLTDYSQVLFLVSLIPLMLLGRGHIGLFGGMILLLIFVVYIYFLTRTKAKAEVENYIPKLQRLFGLIVFGIAMAILLLSANLFVSASAKIAEMMNLSSALIGLTILALGTSLPELILNVTAMFKKKYSIAVGNILGSCVINLTLVLGVGAIISPINVDFPTMGSSTIFLVVVSLLLWFLIDRFTKLDRRIGLGFLGLYLLFILAEIGIIPFIF